MPERDLKFSSKVKYQGVFSFPNFYQFCYDWLTDDIGFKVIENKYSEKIKGDAKDLEIEWTGEKEITDYFKFEINVFFRIFSLKQVEVMQNNVKVTTNQALIEIKTKGTLIKDYKGAFEINAFKKFLRSIYEKWVITSRIEQMENQLAEWCDEFLSQAKAYLDLEGKR